MQKVQKTLKKLFFYVLGFIPQPLPTKGISDLDQWSERIFTTYDLPDMPSYRQAIASMIMHLGNTTHYKAPYYFAKAVKKAMSNQIAYEKIQQLKKEEAEYLKRTEFQDVKGSEEVAG